MHIDRTGIILYTLKYSECVAFYKKVLQLDILFSTPELTCFKFGDSYLMIEIDDTYNGQKEAFVRTRTCLRINVENVKFWTNRLSQLGIEYRYHEHSWGTITKFEDPDGNLLAFKDSTTFEAQVSEAARI